MRYVRNLIRGLAIGILAMLSTPSIAQQTDCSGVAPQQLQKAGEIPDVLAFNTKQSSQQYEAMVQMTVKSIDQQNPAWTSSSPKWLAMEITIRDDMKRGLAAVDERLAKELHPLAACAYAQILSDQELDSLKAYPESVIGKRHLQFGTEVSEIIVKMYMDLLAKASQNNSGPPAKASPEVVQARLDLIQDSLQIGLMQNMGAAVKRNGGDASGYAVFGGIYADMVSLVGEPLDGLGVKYKDDLKGFREFVRSPLMVKHGEAWARLTGRPEFKAAMLRSLNGLVETATKASEEGKRRYRESHD